MRKIDTYTQVIGNNNAAIVKGRTLIVGNVFIDIANKSCIFVPHDRTFVIEVPFAIIDSHNRGSIVKMPLGNGEFMVCGSESTITVYAPESFDSIEAIVA